jgi:hypothetical protein
LINRDCDRLNYAVGLKEIVTDGLRVLIRVCSPIATNKVVHNLADTLKGDGVSVLSRSAAPKVNL